MKKKTNERTKGSKSKKGKSKENPKLTKSEVLERMVEIEQIMDFDGTEFNMDCNLKGCEDGFEYVIDKRLDVVLKELKDLYKKTNGFKGMNSLNNLYEEIVSKTENFIEEVCDLRFSYNYQSREELMEQCIWEVFELRVLMSRLSELGIKGDLCTSDIRQLIEDFENYLVEITLIQEIEKLPEQGYDLKQKVNQFYNDCSMDTRHLSRQLEGMSEGYNISVSEVQDKQSFTDEFQWVETVFLTFESILEKIELILTTEETRCEEIEDEWNHLYHKYSDFLVDDFIDD